jgi:hypothetical protein
MTGYNARADTDSLDRKPFCREDRGLRVRRTLP